MSSSVIDRVNQIELTKGQPSLITFYDRKGNTVGDYGTNISVVDEAPDITEADQQTDEDPQDEYDTTYLEIRQDEQKDEQIDHEADHIFY